MERSLIGTLLFLGLSFIIAFSQAPQPDTTKTAARHINAVQASISAVPVTPTPEPTPTLEDPTNTPSQVSTVTWRDNPHDCNEQTQWISADPPFDCIDKPQPTPSPQPTVQNGAHVSGDKYSWMAAAGISQSDWQYVDYIVGRESGWNPHAVNASSGACGLMQFLPCSHDKAGANWSEPVNALVRGNQYALSRYGSWTGAYTFWTNNHWW